MPITNVDTLKATGGPPDYCNLCLTSSIDFSIKLWNLKVFLIHLDKINDKLKKGTQKVGKGGTIAEFGAKTQILHNRYPMVAGASCRVRLCFLRWNGIEKLGIFTMNNFNWRLFLKSLILPIKLDIIHQM